jgi:hypothetical protein
MRWPSVISWVSGEQGCSSERVLRWSVSSRLIGQNSESMGAPAAGGQPQIGLSRLSQHGWTFSQQFPAFSAKLQEKKDGDDD